MLAAASFDATISIWDKRTGGQRNTTDTLYFCMKHSLPELSQLLLFRVIANHRAKGFTTGKEQQTKLYVHVTSKPELLQWSSNV